MKTWLIDTGPLVALLDADDRHHRWAAEQLGHGPPVVSTCEPVVTEALFLTACRKSGRQSLSLIAPW